MTSSPRAPRFAGGRRPLLAFLLALAVGAAFVAAEPAAAGDKASGRIDIDVALEPADAKPGSDATLVFTLKPLDKKAEKLPGTHFIYATGEKALKYKPLEAAGVTYHLEKLTRTKHGEVKDFGEVHAAWAEPFEVRLPITLGKDVKDGTKVGLSFDYYGCLQEVACYAPIKGHVAAIVLGQKPAAKGPTTSEAVGGSMDGGTVEIDWDEAKQAVIVRFTPEFLHWMYGPGSLEGKPISVTPVKQDGVEWGEPEVEADTKIKDTATVTIPVKKRADDAKRVEVEVTFQACNDTMCLGEVQTKLWVAWPGAKSVAADTPAVEIPKGEVLFPVVENDELGQAESDSSLLQRLLQDTPLLGFGFIFIIGLGLAFTPCVLPILPITVSVISGGNPDIPPKRLATLLGTYVLGLCMTFATMGVIAAMTGGAMSAIFAMPAVQWGFVIVFLALAFAMYGIYELQPPSWLMKLQGGAQKRSGSMIGAFMFGCLGAIIASPCTGPAIAVLLIETAKTGSVAYGFAMFFTLGLGMGAVLFAAGSLNFLMRPGPWMVWVRHTFGIAMVAVAIYYLSQYQLIGETARWIIAGVVCVLIVIGLTWHRHKKEGEDLPVARMHALKVGVLTALAVAFVGWYTKVPDNLLSWTYVKSPEHLQELVADANDEGKPVVVDFWGDWCTNCKVYDQRIASTPTLRERFERITRIKVDLSEDQVRWPMRHALGVEGSGAPIMVFIDRKGRIRRNADVVGLIENEVLAKHIDVVLRKSDAKGSPVGDPKPTEAGKIDGADGGAR